MQGIVMEEWLNSVLKIEEDGDKSLQPKKL